ncbi:MAG: vitamin B12-dependent ribonucleotide reductase [Bdellovibrionales bacterium]|nr:vitamin B12-dependent ribonucleotide reductase [Bdellovibrionales bacterium]
MPEKGIKFQRRWTQPGAGPYAGISWVPRKSRILNDRGEVLFELDNIEAPSFWSQEAIDIAASKYFRREGVPGGKGGETSVRQLIDRVALTIAEQGTKQGIFLSAADEHHFLDELRYLLVRQMAAFNSPVWFNCGLFARYKIKGESQAWRWDESAYQVVATTNAYEYPQSSACFILKVEDSLQSIHDLAGKEARVFKYGSGSGTNFSSVRGKQEKIPGGGTGSGLIAFLEMLDKGAAATKSGGVTRRAAKMVCLDMDHPDLMDFVRWKQREEEKVRALLNAGFSGGLDGEAYRTVSGQNSNNSLRVPDDFMKAVEANQSWSTRARTTGAVLETWRAQEVWQAILEAIWQCGDPGLQFESAIQAAHLCRAEGPIRASNPCSEFMFLDDTACNLASINLARFLNESTGEWDLPSFTQAIRLLIVAQEVLVDFSSYPTEEVALNSHRFRPLGLGFANLGGLLLRLGLAYDSQEGRGWAGALAAWLQAEALNVSAELAQVRGAFMAFNANRESVGAVVAKQRASAQMIAENLAVPEKLRLRLVERFEQAERLIATTGLRHAQLTAIAPTGTIGFLMDCETTGIEPEYSLLKAKKLVGGGIIIQQNLAVEMALKKLGYGPDQRRTILDDLMKFGHLEKASLLKPHHLPVFDGAVASRDGQRFIRAEAHLEMMAAVQPFVSGAISKTVNLPHAATTADIGDLLMKAWRLGLKSIAIYRDGSKAVQPLTGSDSLSQAGSRLRCPNCGHEGSAPGGCFRCLNCGQVDGCP